MYYSDSYQKFKTDIYKIAGMNSSDANIGGLGMMMKNENETISKYVSMLKSKKHDGILILKTRFDKKSAGMINDQYVALEPNQIKLADGSNTTFDNGNADIRFKDGGEIDYSEYKTSVIGLFNENKVLILKRGSTANWMPNKWSLVGGVVDGDENPMEAIIRECVEETGIKPENVVFDNKIYSKDIGSIYYYRGTIKSKDINLDYENSAYAFISESDIEDYEYVPYVKEYIQKIFQKNYMDGGNVEGEYLNVLQKVGITEEERDIWKESHYVNQKQVRNDKVKEAAEKLKNGTITQNEYLKIVAKEQPIKLFTEVPKLPTAKEIVSALDENKVAKGIVNYTTKIEDGRKVATRLDIPAYEKYDTWVVSVHDGIKEGQIIAYGQTALLKNVIFVTSPRVALDIAIGKSKDTVARMHGYWENKSPNDVRNMAIKYMNDPNWVQVGMNPFRHSWFYDKRDGMPLVSASEVIQVGALVLAKNPIKTNPDNDMFIADKKNPSIKFEQGGQFS